MGEEKKKRGVEVGAWAQKKRVSGRRTLSEGGVARVAKNPS